MRGARRLRLKAEIYNRDTRQYRHLPGIGARVTVRNVEEQNRLWREIERTIERGDWRLDVVGSPDDADSPRAGRASAP